MSLWTKMRQWLGGQADPLPTPSATPRFEDEPEPDVLEVTAEDLMAALAGNNPPLVLDVREDYEWRQVRMPGALHIPMNDVPARLDELAATRPLVVVCAHGSRSYSVAAWLGERGVAASSLAGGITRWAQVGGAIAQG